jgi:hypothetical protein
VRSLLAAHLSMAAIITFFKRKAMSGCLLYTDSALFDVSFLGMVRLYTLCSIRRRPRSVGQRHNFYGSKPISTGVCESVAKAARGAVAPEMWYALFPFAS